jgi:hypothetical protein
MDGKIFPCSWINHIKKWVIDNPKAKEQNHPDFLLIRYEDLLRKEGHSIKKVANFLGRSLNPYQVKKVSYKTSKKKMKKKESLGSFNWLPKDMEFIGSGKHGGWKDALSDSILSKIMQHDGTGLKYLGYTE